MPVLDHSKSINKYFEEITAIPHGSKNEVKLSDYLENFAKEQGLDYRRDEMGSLVIYKPASEGYEDHPALMLQAHIDMVCEKNKDCNLNFDTDPLELYVEDGWLKAKGTTLGADDGYGVSYMMGLLSDKNAKHPPLECVFTVQEEIGLFGAAAFDETWLSAKRMIGLDGGGETTTCVSSSGGQNVILTRPVSIVDANQPAYLLSVGGLLGGHSGGAIDKERGNSIKIAFRAMNALLRAGFPLQVADFNGGLKSNAIPRECDILFVTDADFDAMNAVIEKVYAEVKEELEFSDAGVTMALIKAEAPGKALCPRCTKALIKLGYLAPNGLKAKSMEIEGLTTVSLNFGIIRTIGSEVILTFSIRSPMASARGELTTQLQELADLFGAELRVEAEYGGWNFQKESAMRETLREALKDRGIELQERATHGGLETGIFKSKIPELDIVTYGPVSSGAHTPDEMLNLESFERSFETLCYFISKL